MALLAERLQISETTREQVRSVAVPSTSTVIIRDADGIERVMDPRVQLLVEQTLWSIAESDAVRIEQVPEELTTTTAAAMLGVS